MEAWRRRNCESFVMASTKIALIVSLTIFIAFSGKNIIIIIIIIVIIAALP